MEIQPGLFDGNIQAGNVFSLSSLKATIGLYQFHRRHRVRPHATGFSIPPTNQRSLSGEIVFILKSGCIF